MASLTLIWTVLPNGMRGPISGPFTWSASIHIGMRMTTPSPPLVLSDFPDVENWPDTLNALLGSGRLSLEFRSKTTGNPVHTQPVKVISSPVIGPWKALFDSSAPVCSYEFDPANVRQTRIHSYQPDNVENFLKDLYSTIYRGGVDERSAEEPPDVDSMARLLTACRPDQFPDILAQFGEKLARDGALDPIAENEPNQARNFALLAAFHDHRLLKRLRPRDVLHGTNGTTAIAQASCTGPDVHGILEELSGYSDLARLFGLVVDVEFEFSDWEQARVAGAEDWDGVRADVTWTSRSPNPPPTTLVTPYTMLDPNEPVDTRSTSMWFRAKRRDRINVDLMPIVQFNGDFGSRFRVVLADTDHVGMKLINTSDTLAARPEFPNSKLELSALSEFYGAPPTVATDGFAIVYRGRSRGLRADISEQEKIEASLGGKVADVFADHLLRGYRIDVFDVTTKRWHSLCHIAGMWRIYRDQMRQQQIPFPNGEGSMAGEGYIDTALSSDPSAPTDSFLHEALCRWDGWSLVVPRPGFAQQADGSYAHKNRELNRDFKMDVNLEAQPGSLARLRFAHAYRFALRPVDLGCNSHPPISDLSLSEQQAVLGSRSTSEQVYLRFAPVPPPVVAHAARPNLKLAENVDRLIIRSNLGIWPDQFAGAGGNPSGAALPPSDTRHIIPPEGNVKLAEEHGRLDDANGHPDPASWSILSTRDQDLSTLPNVPADLLANNILVIPQKIDRSPYLPDPLARGVLLRGLPGVPVSDGVIISFGDNVDRWPSQPPAPSAPAGTWYDAAPFRIRIVGEKFGNDPNHVPQRTDLRTPPSWDTSLRILTVYMRVGESASVRVSSCISWDSAHAAPNAGSDLDTLGVWRWYRDRFNNEGPPGFKASALNGRHWILTPYHRIELVHAAQQPVWTPNLDSIVLKQRDADATWLAFDAGSATPIDGQSTMHLDAIANWSEIVDDPRRPTPTSRRFDDILTRLEVPMQAESLSLEGVKHEFGNTRHRIVEYRARAIARYPEHFPPEITDKVANVSRTSVGNSRNVLSSARPQAPQIVEVVPAFSWRSIPWRNEVSRRGAARVYLARPWYSSGDGELLAVLLPKLGEAGAPKLLPFVARIGDDPIWKSPSAVTLKSDMFPLAVSVGSQGATLSELSGGADELLVVPIGHAVQFDAQRQLWFVDIEIVGLDAYYPFIRLGLARYQPDSIPGAHLSRVVLADYVQLPSERTVVAFVNAAGMLQIDVRGPGYDAAANAATQVIFRWRIEKRAQPTDPDLMPDGLETWSEVAAGLLAGSHAGGLWTAQIDRTSLDIAATYRVVVLEEQKFDTSGSRLVYAAVLSALGQTHPADTLFLPSLTQFRP